MKNLILNIPDNRIKFFLKLLKELGFVKIGENHYELMEVSAKTSNKQPKKKVNTKNKNSSTGVEEPEFKYEISSNSLDYDTGISEKKIQKSKKITKKERDLVTKRIKSAKESDFIPLEKFEKQMRKKLGYKK